MLGELYWRIELDEAHVIVEGGTVEIRMSPHGADLPFLTVLLAPNSLVVASEGESDLVATYAAMEGVGISSFNYISSYSNINSRHCPQLRLCLLAYKK